MKWIVIAAVLSGCAAPVYERPSARDAVLKFMDQMDAAGSPHINSSKTTVRTTCAKTSSTTVECVTG